MIILITGASHTGKTLLAQKLLERYHYPALSIDHLKMGLIRSGQTKLTPMDDEALSDYLWPIVREMIKTAIENKQNLIVEGSIVSANKFAGGVASYTNNAKLDRIDCRVNIVGTFEGDGTHGGIVGVNEGAGTVINNSVFSGSISGTAHWCAGVVGWSGADLKLSNCIVIADISAGLHEMTYSDVIARNNRTATNCYYVTPYGGAPEGATQVTPEELKAVM